MNRVQWGGRVQLYVYFDIMYVINIVFVVGQLRPNYFLEVGGQGVLLIDPVNIVHGLEFREANKYGEMDPKDSSKNTLLRQESGNSIICLPRYMFLA